MGSHRVFYIALAVIGVAVILAQTGAYYYLQKMYNSDSSKESASCKLLVPNSSALTSICVSVNTLINFGNTTIKWYNGTRAPADWNVYSLTVYLAHGNIESTFYGPPLNEHYVTGISGIRNAGRSYWTLWMLCQSRGAWTVSPVGADRLSLSNGDIFAWAYEVLTSPNPDQPPLPGARITGSCS